MGWSEPVGKEETLREWNMGILQGHTHNEGQQMFGEEMRRMHTDSTYAIPEGESHDDFKKRCVCGMESIADRCLTCIYILIITIYGRCVCGMESIADRHIGQTVRPQD